MEPTSNFPDFGLPESNPEVGFSAVPDRGSDVSHETKSRIRQSVNRQNFVSSTAVEAEIQALGSLALTHPQQAQVFGVMSPQSRAGKTSFTINLAATFARQGFKVLLLDMAQSASEFLGGTNSSMSEVLRGNCLIEDVAQQVLGYDSFFYVAADASLDVVELELSYSVAKETRLLRALRNLLTVENDWDYVLIDTPSSLGLLSLNALLAADNILTPLPSDTKALTRVQSLEWIIEFAEQNFEKRFSSLGAVAIGTESLALEAQKSWQSISSKWHILATEISWSREIQETDRCRQIVVDEYPVSEMALEYMKCAREINKAFV